MKRARVTRPLFVRKIIYKKINTMKKKLDGDILSLSPYIVSTYLLQGYKWLGIIETREGLEGIEG